MKALPISDLDKSSDGPFYALLKELLEYDRLFEDERDPPLEELLQILAQAEKVIFKRPSQFMKGKRTAFVGFLVQQRHIRYLRWRIEQKPAVIQSQKYACRARPLIDFACDPDTSMGSDLLLRTSPTQVEMVHFILHAGDSLNLRYKDSTVWELFLNRVRQKAWGNTAESRKVVLEISKLLVQNGADLSEMVTLQQGSLKITAEQILRNELAGIEGLTELFKIQRSKYSSLFHWMRPWT